VENPTDVIPTVADSKETRDQFGDPLGRPELSGVSMSHRSGSEKTN
jgi:hypothetical protein